MKAGTTTSISTPSAGRAGSSSQPQRCSPERSDKRPCPKTASPEKPALAKAAKARASKSARQARELRRAPQHCCLVAPGSRDGVLQNPAFRVLRPESHQPSNGAGDTYLVGCLIHHHAPADTRPCQQGEDFVRGAGVEMMLAGDIRQRIVVPPAVGHDDEDGIVAILRVGF